MSITKTTTGSGALDYDIDPINEADEYYAGATYRVESISLSLSSAVIASEDFVVSTVDKDTAVSTVIYRNEITGYQDIILIPVEMLFDYNEKLNFTFTNSDALTYTLKVRYSFFIDVFDWRDDLLTRFDGFTQAQIDTAILESCRIFCKKTGLWTQKVTEMNVISGQSDYIFSNFIVGEIVSVDGVWIDDEPLKATTEYDLDNEYPTWRTETAPNPTHYIMQDRGTLKLYPEPNVDNLNSMDMNFVIKPFHDANYVPQFLFNDYSETIEYGAKRILFQRRNGDKDLRMSEYYKDLFERSIDSAVIKDVKGFTKTTVATSIIKNYF